jgi:molecular chaperone GrpE
MMGKEEFVAQEEEVVDEVLDADEQVAEGDVELEEVVDEEQSPENELEQAQAEVIDLRDKLLRMAAEFENYKKRMMRDKGHALKYAEEGIIKELLPSIDNLERAIEQGQNTDNAGDLLEGVEMTLKGLVVSLEKFELKSLDSIGQPFDPNIHEALAMEETDEMEPSNVLREFEKGYTFKEKLIRPAKVVVSKKNK